MCTYINCSHRVRAHYANTQAHTHTAIAMCGFFFTLKFRTILTDFDGFLRRELNLWVEHLYTFDGSSPNFLPIDNICACTLQFIIRLQFKLKGIS